MPKTTFLNLKLNATYSCVETKTGQKLTGVVTDLGQRHAKIKFTDGTHIDLDERSDVSLSGGKLYFDW